MDRTLASEAGDLGSSPNESTSFGWGYGFYVFFFISSLGLVRWLKFMKRALNFFRFFVLIAVFSFSALVYGAAETQGGEVPEVAAKSENLVSGEREASTFELVGRIFIYLLLLGAIGVAVLYFFRQGKFVKGMRGQGKLLKVLETHMLGNKQFLVVVEYEERKVLLGVGPGMINKLCFLDNFRKKDLISEGKQK